MVSEDYPRLKELLDNGERIACYIDEKYTLSSGNEVVFRDIAEARMFDDDPIQYNIGVRGRVYCSVYPAWFRDYSDEKMFEIWKSLNLQFIDPDYSRNNVELKLIEIWRLYTQTDAQQTASRLTEKTVATSPHSNLDSSNTR